MAENVFAYVEYSRLEKYSPKHAQIFELSQYRQQTKKRPDFVLHLQMVVKRVPQILTDKVYFIKPISRIKPSLRKFSALEDASTSQLFAKLLKPEPSTFFVRQGLEGPKYPTNLVLGSLNEEQRKIMSACASMATSNMGTPQAAVIQGPPGTGKSTTITAMILQIFFRWKQLYPGQALPRILLTGE